MTEKSILLAGFGGQGILLGGEVLANALMIDDKQVSWYPCYGAQVRGGTVNCEIVTADEEISAVNKNKNDFIITLNQLSFDKFVSKVSTNGFIIANSSLVKEIKTRENINFIFAPVTQMAEDLGSAKITNIISLGILAKISGLTSIESLHKALDNVLPEHRKNLLPLNLKALEKGFNYI